MVRSIKGSGRKQPILEMGEEFKFGRMVLVTMGSGKTGWLTVEEGWCMLKATCTMVSGSKTKPTDTECNRISKAAGTKVNGKMTNKTERALRSGLMAQHMTVNTKME